MNQDFVMKLIRYPPIGKLALKVMKNNALKPFLISSKVIAEKQEKILQKKFRILEQTEIGRKLGVKAGGKLESLPITDYEFYEPFFNNPSSNSLMYPLNEYERTRTSGTSGKEKWFLIPRSYIYKSIIETAIQVQLFSTHDGEKIRLDYGDTIYINTAPRPFLGGVMVSVASGKNEKPPLFNVVPNFNISFEDKVKYFTNNCDQIDVAVTQASILVSQIMPAAKKPVKLKGLFCPDTAIAEAYFNEIQKFTGVTPRTAYGSTETLHCSIPSVQHPLGFFLDWRRGFFEFKALKHDQEEKEIVGIDQVKVGEVYRVIFTNLEADLTRYDTSNSFKCIATGDDSLGVDYPVFKFHSRLDKTISLHNFTRINENELTTALKESKIQCVEFVAKSEITEGLEYLTLYLETTGSQNKEDISKAIHNSLYQMDEAYKDLVDFYNYSPIKVILLPEGTFGKYLTLKAATVSKVGRIEMPDEEINKLIQIAKSKDKTWQST